MPPTSDLQPPTSRLTALPSHYDHAAAQQKWYPLWEERGYFHADPASDKPPFTIVIPPPNVTGALHLGHALNNTLQDILCRMKRMQGFNVLWMPGTDHAGIATQAVVERRLLEEEKLSRHDLGREELVKRIWAWKEQYEKRILGQLKQLGASCDWERLRFTLDDQCAGAVRETFFKLFKDGNIYRGKRLVNWDTFLQTAVSDDEVFHEVKKGHFWHFKYPVIGAQAGEPTHVTIATTRPETMLGDTAVAVHPNPERQLEKVEAELEEKLAAAPEKEKADIQTQIDALGDRRKSILPGLIQLRAMAKRGVKLKLPLTGREIPLITDTWAKPELGSGCVKITPGHDPNDYEVWQRNESIDVIDILHADGTLNDSVPEKYRSLTMKQARKSVIEDLTDGGFHDPETDVEDREIDLAHSDRSKKLIEPRRVDQWFLDMHTPFKDKRPCLADMAINAVEEGGVTIIPNRYAKGYQDWLGEKRDWPIGRQLWWGHRIPVWKLTLQNLSPSKDIKQTREEFLVAWNEFSESFGIGNEISLSPTADDSISYFLCAGTDKAKEVLGYLYGSARNVDSNDEKPNPGPPILTSDPRHTAFRKVMQLAILGKQDDDVLDTWFSSALWPHSTLGWPEKTEELKKFYPTSTLITSRDIITLWVARMVLMGEYNLGEVPFSEVFIHPKILDGYGETMSKSKGNGVDPLDVIEKFGADALRFGIAYLTTETQDVRMPVEFECPHCQKQIKQTKKNRILPRVECDKCKKPFSTQWAQTDEDLALPRGSVVSERFELGRNFCNKLWNASRFALINLEGYEATQLAANDLLLEDRWLLSRLATVTAEVTSALAEYRYADAARELYSFAWDDFCSFYVEMVKARFAVPEQRAVAQQVMAHTLDSLLRLLHPITPFLTEEVWHLLGSVATERGLASPETASESVCIAPWPESNAADIDLEIESQFATFQAVLGAVRETRMGQNIPPKESLKFCVHCDAGTAELLKPMQPYFESMARATATAIGPDAVAPEQSISKPLTGMEVHVDISDFFDAGAEQDRLDKKHAELEKFINSMQAKLSNENFTKRAPAEVVEQQQKKLEEMQQQLLSVVAALEKLSN